MTRLATPVQWNLLKVAAFVNKILAALQVKVATISSDTQWNLVKVTPLKVNPPLVQTDFKSPTEVPQ